MKYGSDYASLGEVADESVEQAGPVTWPQFVYVDIGSIDREQKTVATAQTVSIETAPSRAKQRLRTGDVLVSMTRPNLNAVAIVPASLEGAIGSTGFHVLRSKYMVPQYLYFLVQSQQFVDAMCAVVQGALYPAVRPSDINAFGMRIPSRIEQTRIVDKLEELLSDLDAGVAELKAAQKKLAQYRQSLLKAAVEGRLTEAWREQRGQTTDSEESGAQLLARILHERRARWEAKQLAKFEAQGKAPLNGWQEKYPEPEPATVRGLPKLPASWAWASIEQVASDDAYSLAIGPFGSNLKVADYCNSGVPLVFVRNIRSGRYGGTVTKYVSQEKALELRAHSVRAGDVLITKMGEPPGDADVYPTGHPPAVITADCIKVSCCAALMSPQFLVWTINSEIGRQQIRPMTQGVAQKKVSLGRFSRFAVPLAPIVEQLEIVELTSNALLDADEKQRAINYALRQSAAQRKNILQAAFSGQLVPQDPNDEPASVLLARIRAERAAQETNGTRSRLKKKAVA